MAEAGLTYATGKRKTAVARVWIGAGQGAVTVNGKSAADYFERETLAHDRRSSRSRCSSSSDKYDVRATVAGGGHSAQAEALRHGIARALTREDPQRRTPLKRAGFLTRDDPQGRA